MLSLQLGLVRDERGGMGGTQICQGLGIIMYKVYLWSQLEPEYFIVTTYQKEWGED